jgi:hypothetical protein
MVLENADPDNFVRPAEEPSLRAMVEDPALLESVLRRYGLATTTIHLWSGRNWRLQHLQT